ncbi:VOC family protein [Tissierella sp. MB52-C2]|uniref:VOC family protein n=1 Tax=Tissierella sp. MB52-C2 TaxID=3070999 RepID=UPI00280A6FA1|nr:VOC family protein [Tissierella sp. MB52-C2]WMM24479.1 VOC family protein [Tissierella sp. MB52-C2]
MSKFHEKPNIFVNHIVLKVVDVKRTVEFYTEIMGLKILDRREKEVILTADGVNPIVTIVEPDNAIPKLPRRTGIYHFALLLPSRFHLGLFLKHLREKSYPIIGGAHHGVSEAIYLEDPDGNGIEVYRDIDSEEWKRKENQVEMVTDPLDYDSIILDAGEGKWDKIPKETIIGHIHLHVGDLDEAKKFYCDGLGFDLVMKLANSALFISSGGYHHHIGLNIWNGKNSLALPDNAAGMKYYSIIFPGIDVRENTINNLRNLGYDVIREDNNIFTKDPSTNLIKLVV